MHGQHQRVIGGLRPPQRRHGQLREIVFRLREFQVSGDDR
jgi:hypothetical protein